MTEETMTIECRTCKKEIPITATPEQIAAWKGGLLIQKAMPNVPKDEREMFISGICGVCWDIIFPPEEEER